MKTRKALIEFSSVEFDSFDEVEAEETRWILADCNPYVSDYSGTKNLVRHRDR